MHEYTPLHQLCLVYVMQLSKAIVIDIIECPPENIICFQLAVIIMIISDVDWAWSFLNPIRHYNTLIILYQFTHTSHVDVIWSSRVTNTRPESVESTLMTYFVPLESTRENWWSCLQNLCVNTDYSIFMALKHLNTNWYNSRIFWRRTINKVLNRARHTVWC